MKKFYLIAGALAVLLSSCAKTEVVSVSDGNLIGFGNAFVGNPTKAGLPADDQYGASKLPPQFFAYANTDASTVVLQAKKFIRATTRGSMTTSKNGNQARPTSLQPMR